MVLAFAAYSVGGYGWVLVKGWDIPFRKWMSPVHPYQWPAGDPPPIPANKLFPSSAAPGGAAAGGASGGGGGGTNPVKTPAGLNQPGGSRSFLTPGQVPGSK